MVILGVGITVLAVLIVGVLVAKKVDGDSDNFLVAGRRLGVPLVAVSLAAAAVDANATVGNTDLTADFGFWAGASLALGLAICLLLAGLFLAKPLNAMRLYTLGDFFRVRYGRGTEVVASVIMAFAFTILLAGNLVACGFLMERFANIPYAWGIVLTVTLVLAYTIAGGLFSDAYTAAIQTTITVIASIALLVWTAMSFGIVIPEGMGPFDLGQLTDSAQGAPINWATLVALGIGDLVAIDFMQRIFGARTPQIARRSCFTAAALTAVVGTIFALVALTASAVLGLTAADGPVLYQLLDGWAPPLLSIVVLSGIVAASFSTASGAILATSAVIVRNIFRRRRSTDPSVRDRLLTWTRAAMVPIVVIGAFLAIQVSQTGILLTLAFDLMLACLAGPFIAGVFWRRPGLVAALVSAIFGFVLRIVFLALQPTLYGVPNDILYVPNTIATVDFDGWATLLAAAASFTLFVIMSWLTPRTQAELDDELATLDDLRAEQSRVIDDEERMPAAV
ncbi:sodium:solute symporter family protein [Salinibacterium sp. SYSU T00001]|uniref:sodium:solute symporter family protein n=1 Tax=Homoserinimonas sedimenticola TaxID=2986805 RepID=UPI002236B61B|nr:sodium:solute symporter family protein [Salinibacterium sedimenticola]MCW4385382.1 sodium:solute symporter family protein [Salinibacterium sedimenticola]